jgi:hypothetical protein
MFVKITLGRFGLTTQARFGDLQLSLTNVILAANWQLATSSSSAIAVESLNPIGSEPSQLH